MNYGYEPTSFDPELATKLQDMIDKKYAGKQEGGGAPYVETNGLYPGVRIRRITHLPQDLFDQLPNDADTIYRKLIEKHKTQEV